MIRSKDIEDTLAMAFELMDKQGTEQLSTLVAEAKKKRADATSLASETFKVDTSAAQSAYEKEVSTAIKAQFIELIERETRATVTTSNRSQ